MRSNLSELIVPSGEKELRYPLGEMPCGIGRSDQNTVVLQSEMISRNHALIRKNDSGGFTVYDLGSRNGTLLNGRRLTAPTALQNGDVLSIGEFTLMFADSAEPGPAVPSGFQETAVLFTYREITVLVIDIIDFTGLALELGEVRTAELMGAFNRAAGEILENQRAWSVKYIGDAVMAIWNHSADEAPLAVLRTVFQAILEIRTLVEGLQDRFNLPRPLQIGVGVNTGVASIGNLGSGIAADHTAMGDVVNKAFRLEASTRLLGAEVAFGSEVHRVLGDTAVSAVTRAQQIQLKGYAKACDVFSMPLAKMPELMKLISPQVQPS